MLKSRLKSFKFAFTGIAELFKSEPNARIHGVMTIFVIIAGFFFSISTTEWCFITLSIAAVLSAEGFNSAIESLTDLVSPEYHKLAEKTKDLAAGAVLLFAMGAATVGLIIFLPKVLHWIANF